jgi:hypothetical protein
MAQGSGRLAFWAAALLLVGMIVCFWTFRVVLADTEYSGWGWVDLIVYYYPHYQATFAQIAQGRLPIWNPYQLCGIPWLASLQIGVFYPSHVLYVFLPTGVAMAASSLLHFLLVGVSVAVFAHRVGLGVPAALLAAALCTMRGSMPLLTVSPNAMEAAAWLAPGAVGLLGLARGAGARSIGLLAISTAASILAGYPQNTVYIVYAWGALLAVLLVQQRAPLTGWVQAGAGFLASLLLGALLASVQLLPSLELAAQATRDLGGLTRREMFPFGLGARSLGDAVSLLLSSPVSDLAWSLGVVGLALLPLALLGRRHRSLGIGVTVLGLLVLGVAVGPVTPLFDLYLLLPLVDSFRLPQRILFILDFCFAVAAAVGLEATRLRVSRSRWGSPRLASALAALVMALAVGELLADAPKRVELPYFEEEHVRIYQRARARYEQIAKSGQRVVFWNPGIIPPLPSTLGSVSGMRAVDGDEPMSLRRHAEYFTYLTRGTARLGWRRQPWGGRLVIPADPEDARAFASRRRLLDLAAVRFILAPAAFRRNPTLKTYVEAAGLERSGRPRAGTILFENPHVLPRAYVTHRVLQAPPAEELLALLSRSDFDPLAVSYVEGDPALGLPSDPPARGKPAAIVRDEATLVEIEVELEAPGLLVLADTEYPGWRASVGGEPIEILRTNHLFRGVPLPAGRHVVRFEYRSTRLALGAAASAAGAALLVLLLCRGRRAPPRTATAVKSPIMTR